MNVTGELEKLLGTLGKAMEGLLEDEPELAVPGQESKAAATAGPGDAIDQILSAGVRTTGVTSLRESPVVTAFRDELGDGLIRVDTANRLLRLVNEIITRLL